MLLMIVANANAVLAFFLELGVLAALGYWGYRTGSGMLMKIVLATGVPLVAVIVWSLFGAPNATWHLNDPWRFILYVIFFGSAAVALFSAGRRVPGITFALVFMLNFGLMYALGQ